MIRKFSLLLPAIWAVLFLVLSSSAQLQGTVSQDSIWGSQTERWVRYSIYLPEGYAGSTQHYPVIYHLHGLNGSYAGPQVTQVAGSFEEALSLGIIGPVIVITPDGYSNSFWADSWDDSKPAETNLVEELIPAVDSLYRTIPGRAHRVIQGMSMGGFGTGKFITKFPELFCVGVLYDGAMLTWQNMVQSQPGIAASIFNNNESYFNQYSPYYWAAQHASILPSLVDIRMVVGALAYNQVFLDTLTFYGIPCDYVETGLPHSLPQLLDAEGLNSAAFIASHLGSPPLEVNLTPVNPPIVIPAQGSQFQFNASVVNHGPNQTPFFVWARIKYPNGTFTPPTLGPVLINPPVNTTISRLRVQNIPATFPAGLYQYWGYANGTFTYPAQDLSLFLFTKSGDRSWGLEVGDFSCSGELFPGESEETRIAVSLGHDMSERAPARIFPNPFNASTVASFDLRVASHVRLLVYDTTGRLITTLVNGWREAGSHEVTFDGSGLAAGLYFTRIEAGTFQQVQKVILLK